MVLATRSSSEPAGLVRGDPGPDSVAEAFGRATQARAKRTPGPPASPGWQQICVLAALVAPGVLPAIANTTVVIFGYFAALALLLAGAVPLRQPRLVHFGRLDYRAIQATERIGWAGRDPGRWMRS